MVDKIGQDIYGILIFGFLLVDFVEQFLVFRLDLLQLILSLLLFHLIVHNSLLEELGQITFAEVILFFLSLRIIFFLTLLRAILLLLQLFFKNFDLGLIFLDDPVTKVGSFGELILYFRVFFQLDL